MDEFIVATKKVPLLSKNADFFSYFIKHPYFRNEIILEQTGETVKFISKVNNKIIGKYKDGVVEVIEPFAKDGKFTNQMLKGGLFANTIYKVRGQMGTSFLLQTDGVGNVVKAEAKNITPENLVTNILRRREKNINLGEAWPDTYKKLQQYSKGADIDVSIKFSYEGKNPNPKTVKIEAKRGDKVIVDDLFSNIDYSIPKKYTAIQNSSIIKSFQKKLSIPTEKVITLQNLMDADVGFADFIHSNPEFNIKRWLKTRNHVNEKLIIKTPKGRFPPNAKVYAGNVYYFNRYLNPGLASRLSNNNGLAQLKKAGILSVEQLDRLDKLYPNGVPFSKSGFPDFSGVAAKGADGKPIVINIGSLTNNSKVDIAMAEKIYQSQGGKATGGFTWHHIEGTTSLMRVPTEIHQLIDHAGGVAMSK